MPPSLCHSEDRDGLAQDVFIITQSFFTLIRVQPGLPMSSSFSGHPQPLRVQGLSSFARSAPLAYLPKPSLPVDSFLSGFSFNFHGGKMVTNGAVASPQQLPHPLGPYLVRGMPIS